MGSTAPCSFPVIDFSKEGLKPGNEEWELVKSQVQKALEEYGCFKALFNKVPSDVREGLMDAIKELHDIPLENKLSKDSRKPFHGFIRQNLYEAIAIEEANIAENVDNFTSAFWPQGNQTFSKTVHSYSEKVAELDQIIRRMIVESLGLEKYMDEHINSTTYSLRVIKYEAPETTEAKIGFLPHTDKSFTTILCQNQVAGLEVRNKDNEWMNVELSPDTFFVVIGDSFFAWSNGLLRSTDHRVMMTGNKKRYSAGLFAVPKAGYIIKAPQELIDEDHPLLFKPFEYVGFLKFLLTEEAGRKAESPLKAYCGV